MPQSLGKVLVHVVFGTKGRAPAIEAALRPALHAYLVGVVNGIGCRSIQVGGVADHVHALVSLGRTHSVAELVKAMKGSSSRWMARQAVVGFA